MIVHICTERERTKPSDKCGIILVVLTEYHLQRLKENSKVAGIHNQFAGETKEEMLRAVEQRSTTGIVGEKFSSLNSLDCTREEREERALENSGKYKWPVEHGPYACKFTFKTLDTLPWQGLNSR